MIDDRVRDDIALICEAIEEGRGYATASGQGLVVWGIALAAGFVATYAFVRGYQSALPPAALWPLAIAVPWAYWLRRVWGRAQGDAPAPSRSPLVVALRMLWLGLGIFLTTLTLAVLGAARVRRTGSLRSPPGRSARPCSRRPGLPVCCGCAGWRSIGGSANWRWSRCATGRRRCCCPPD
jgi:hypothetical protein